MQAMRQGLLRHSNPANVTIVFVLEGEDEYNDILKALGEQAGLVSPVTA
jgi:hypothetical protein